VRKNQAKVIKQMKFKLIVATRVAEQDFYTKTATGRSLAFHMPPFLEVQVFPNNSEGLGTLYNRAIRESSNDPAILIFAHDDLHILDYYWLHRIADGLKNFGVIGLAGNRRRVSRQPSWAFVDTKFTWDAPENLSGVVGHGRSFPPSALNIFGPPYQQVLLLDGLLLASESKTLIENNLLFDERFKFHFYDLDFCRQAEIKNISCGTLDLSLIHESVGSFGSDAWKISYQQYLEKWGS
jgi:hypothetical protein